MYKDLFYPPYSMSIFFFFFLPFSFPWWILTGDYLRFCMIYSHWPTEVISCPRGRVHSLRGSTSELTLTIPGHKLKDTIMSGPKGDDQCRGFGRGGWCVAGAGQGESASFLQLDALTARALGRRKEVGVEGVYCGCCCGAEFPSFRLTPGPFILWP